MVYCMIIYWHPIVIGLFYPLEMALVMSNQIKPALKIISWNQRYQHF